MILFIVFSILMCIFEVCFLITCLVSEYQCAGAVTRSSLLLTNVAILYCKYYLLMLYCYNNMHLLLLHPENNLRFGEEWRKNEAVVCHCCCPPSLTTAGSFILSMPAVPPAPSSRLWANLSLSSVQNRSINLSLAPLSLPPSIFLSLNPIHLHLPDLLLSTLSPPRHFFPRSYPFTWSVLKL